MRRRPVRLGQAPKLSGVPTFLIIQLLSATYLALFTWQSVARDAKRDPATLDWHMLGVLVVGFGVGMTKGASKLQLRGMRDDSFLEALPLSTPARLGLQLADGLTIIPCVLSVPLAALAASHRLGLGSLLPALLALSAFVACFVAGQTAAAWTRALGPASAARFALYLGVCLNLAGLLAVFVPFGGLSAHPADHAASRLASGWLGPPTALLLRFCASGLLAALAYRLLRAAEHFGFDQLEARGRTPKPHKGRQDRVSLERVMMLREGGRVLLVLASLLALAAFVGLLLAPARVWSLAVPYAGGFVIYLGALQTISQAGRAAQRDLLARSFLSALPLQPHQVLEGKVRALRRLLLPVLWFLALLAGWSAWRSDFDHGYRLALAWLSMYVVADGAVSVAFLSSSVGTMGALGAGSGQSSGLSTQILMLPLFATVVAPNAWTATTASIAVIAVSWEARRAARTSVRWLDDPADDVERETTVWRALLAATAFFAAQAVSYGLLSGFGLPTGYLFAATYASGALLLALLTWRNHARFEPPHFLPSKLWCWPLGALGGAGSGLFALELARRLPLPGSVEEQAPSLATGERVAMFLTLTVVAPLIEEYFFRGWLQKAIEADLPAGRKHWAFALGAATFALAHLGSYGVPQLVLGLLAGGLFALGGGLWPGILAHAVHNGVVLLAGQ